MTTASDGAAHIPPTHSRPQSWRRPPPPRRPAATPPPRSPAWAPAAPASRSCPSPSRNLTMNTELRQTEHRPLPADALLLTTEHSSRFGRSLCKEAWGLPRLWDFGVGRPKPARGFQSHWVPRPASASLHGALSGPQSPARVQEKEEKCWTAGKLGADPAWLHSRPAPATSTATKTIN